MNTGNIFRGIVLVTSVACGGAFAAQADSILLEPLSAQNLTQFPDLNGPQGNFGDFEYNGNDILYHQAVIFSDANSSGGVSLERVDKMGGVGLTGRGGVSSVVDGGIGSGFFYNKIATSGYSGKPFFSGFLTNGANYTSTASSRGWAIIKYRGLKNGSTNTGVSTSNSSFPYRLRSKAIALPNLNLESINATYPINFGIALNRIVDFQVFVHPDFPNNDPNQSTDLYPMRFLPFATPSVYVGGGKSGFNYSLKNNTLCLLKSANGNMFSQNSWTSPTKFTSTSVSRGWLKLDYISAQCGDAVSGYAFTQITGTQRSGDCAGGANGDFVMQTSGPGLGGSADDLGFYGTTSTATNLRITATLDQVEKTNANAQFGLTFRQSTAPNSTHASVLITPTSGVWGMSRQSTGAGTGTANITGVKTPVKVRLTKTGTTFKHEYQNSSGTWVQIGGVFPISSFSGTYRYGFIGGSKQAGRWMTGSGTTIQVETSF